MSRKFVIYKWIAILIVTFSLPTIWGIKIMRDNMPYLDLLTRPFVDTVAETTLYSLARWVTNFGSAFFLVPFTAIVGILIYLLFRDWLIVLFFTGGTLLAYLVNSMIKLVIARERPMILAGVNAEGYSFPSGHSMIPLVCYGFLTYLIVRNYRKSKWTILLQSFTVLLVLSIGFSRYILNVHYITDIITGFIIGLLFLFSLIKIFKKSEQIKLKKH